MPGIERQRPTKQHVDRATALAALPRDRLVAAIAAALAASEADSRTDARLAVPESPAAARLVAELRKRVAEQVGRGHPGQVLFDQSMLACPGLPWHVAVDGELVLEGRHALAVPSAAVDALLDSGWVEPVPGRESRRRATLRGAAALGIPEHPVEAAPPLRKGLRHVPRPSKRGRIAA